MRKAGFAAAFYHSYAWEQCREAYARSVGGLCEDCAERGIVTPGVDVHHVVRLTPENIGDPAITLSWSNLRLLCESCHEKRHRFGRRWTVDDNGHVTGRVR